jgi:hypothetical protein
VLLTLAKQRAPEGGNRWLAEMTSLAAGPVLATVTDRPRWEPAVAGVVMQKFPKAPQPAEDAPKRLRQMREIVRQIKAHEFFAPGNQPLQRYERRALSQPVYRYQDEGTGLIDGGIFIISYGQNPEFVLILEARREPRSDLVWTYGLARIAVAEAHVEYDGKEIWSHPGGFPKGPHDTYWVFTKPAD